jgi:MoaA/NifB/PqqE/SkfB family radical SAM enzyme
MVKKQFEKVTIEISNICNAKCKWCTTGIYNQSNTQVEEYMKVQEFTKGIDYLLENHIINNKTEIELYNWGEPFLNPNLKEILFEIVKRKLKYHLSTNGSKLVEIDKNLMNDLNYIVFSMPGFSQKSYNRIHKLNFQTVTDNIRKTAIHFKQLGYVNKIMVNYHVYKFNLDEIELAREFCEELGIGFVPTFAYFNDFKMFNNFLDKSIKSNDLLEAANDLFLDFYEEEKKNMPQSYRCPEYNYLVLDHKFNILPCCRLTSSYKIGNLFDYSLEEIREIKEGLSICDKCKFTGQHYIVHQSTLYPKWYTIYRDKIFSLKKEKLFLQNELEKHEKNLKVSIEQRENLKEELKEYDSNLKISIDEKLALQEELKKYQENLQEAIKQRENLKEEVKEYDSNLKISIDEKLALQEELEKYQENLQEAIKQRENLKEEVKEYDINLKVCIEQKEEINKELANYTINLTEAINQKNTYKQSLDDAKNMQKILVEQINNTKQECLTLKEELINIKSSKAYKIMKKISKQ